MGLACIMLAVLALSVDANARKFGGGKSFGKSFRTAPQKTLSQRQNAQPNSRNALNSGRRSGMMGGLLGGLLAGGLFAWLLGSGAFQGLQMMDVLIIAVIAFIGFRLLRGILAQKALQAQGSHAASSTYRTTEDPSAQGGFASSSAGNAQQYADDVPFDLPENFDVAAFLDGSRSHYHILQTAWNQNDLEKMREYLAPELYQNLEQERSRLGDQILDNQILYVDASLERSAQEAGHAQLSVHFRGKYRDSEGQELVIDEIWHLRRELAIVDANWLIEGIEERGE